VHVGTLAKSSSGRHPRYVAANNRYAIGNFVYTYTSFYAVT
jgi:hypothetical protein